MVYQNKKIAEVAAKLKKRLDTLKNKAGILKAAELRALYAEIPTLKPAERVGFGKEVNQLKQELQQLVDSRQRTADKLPPIDVTAPFDVNVPAVERPQLLSAAVGSKHPLMVEIELISDIFYRMGFNISESRLLDDEYHMFTSLNFPAGHPARDDYDTFMTEEKDAQGRPYIAPAHTSTMQNRLLKKYKKNLYEGRPIAVLVPDRVFRNEDLDARHEHTFYQTEGIYVDRNVNVGNLMATLKVFLQEYYQKELDVKTQPFYFPFTEPSFEFAMSCPFCIDNSGASGLDAGLGSSEERTNRTHGTESERKSVTDNALRQEPAAGMSGSVGQQGKAANGSRGCNVCSYSGWIELLGCGMIHPNVLKMAGIDPSIYTGFAWGCGVDRLVMMKYGIEDIRHFESGKLEFLRQFR